MRTETTIDGMQSALQGAAPVCLVPTMGNLHAGHIALVREARRRAEPGGRVVTSIFVNRLQFGQGEDFDRYPRTFERDTEQLAAAGCDVLFAPNEAQMYPEPQTFRISPDPALAKILEGEFRPGHFDGVCTVVMKLFTTVRPQVAIFGKKDYQQLMMIRRMTRQFALPIQIVGHDTIREPDGLAMSSRNGYLNPSERNEAKRLSALLRDFVETIRRLRREGRCTMERVLALEQATQAELSAHGWSPDYVTLRRCSDLLPPAPNELDSSEPLVVLAAARLGQPRLLDNLEI